eukprot:1587092-Rhodomonas_salina.2
MGRKKGNITHGAAFRYGANAKMSQAGFKCFPLRVTASPTRKSSRLVTASGSLLSRLPLSLKGPGHSAAAQYCKSFLIARARPLSRCSH